MLKCDKCGKEFDFFISSCDECGTNIKPSKDMEKWSKLSREEQEGIYHKIKNDTIYHNPKFYAAILFLIFLILDIFILIAISFINWAGSDPLDSFLNLISFGGILYITFPLLVINLILFIVFISISISSGNETIRNEFPVLLFQNGIYYDLKIEDIDIIIFELKTEK